MAAGAVTGRPRAPTRRSRRSSARRQWRGRRRTDSVARPTAHRTGRPNCGTESRARARSTPLLTASPAQRFAPGRLPTACRPSGARGDVRNQRPWRHRSHRATPSGFRAGWVASPFAQSANTSRLCWMKKVWSWPLFGSSLLYFVFVGAVGHGLLGVDRADRADVGLIAGRARRALVHVHVQHRVTEDGDASGLGWCVFSYAAAGLLLGEEQVLGGVELVDALHGADVDARPVLGVDARLGDDCDSRTWGGLPGQARANTRQWRAPHDLGR